MSVKDRIYLFIDFKGITVKKFEMDCGLSNGYVASMRKGFGADKLNNVLLAYPDLNRDWLLYGEGEMLKSAEVQPTQEVDVDTMGVIPVVPISAMGGALTGFDPTISITDCEMMISPISDAELAIGVYGDSMAPEYPNGSRVLIKKIDMTAFIEWGKAYVLSTTNGSIVKVVYPADEKSVECRSLNPAYPPFTVKYKDIHAMYKILMCMSLK